MNFPLSLLIGPTLPSFPEFSELCQGISVLLTAENVERIGIHRFTVSRGFSSRIVNLPNFVTVRIKSESSLLLNFQWRNTGYERISMFFLRSTVLRF